MGGQAVSFDDSLLQEGGHVCAFFNSRDQEYRVLLPFIKEGFNRGEKAFHIIDPPLHEDHLHRLRAEGIDVESAMLRKQLEIAAWPMAGPQLEGIEWDDAHLKGGRLDQSRMVAVIEEILNSGRAQHFPHTRFLADMAWALHRLPGVEDLVEFEARVNRVLPKYKDPVICVYDVSKFDAGVLMDMLRVHPLVIVGDMLQRNPFYTPPDEFLRELRKRGASCQAEGLASENKRLSKTVRD